MLSNIRRLIRFRLERLLLRGAHARLLVIAAMVLLTSLVFGVMAWYWTDAFRSVADAVWWAFLRLSDPGYLGDDEGVLLRIISTVVTVLGYVLFLGALVAIMTQWLNHTIESYEEGATPISLSGHLLILGWTNRTPPLVKEILLSEGRVERFLKRYGLGRFRIVILAEADRREMLRELKEDLGERWRHGQVVFRTGSPLRLEHLERTNFTAASAIIIPGTDVAEGSTADPDDATIKSMLAVSTWSHGRETLPVLVAEVLDAARKSVAEEAYAGRVETVATEATASLMLAQTLRHAWLAEVFTEILTHSKGSELYICEAKDLEGRSFGDLAMIHPRAVPVGILRSDGKRRRAWLNPPSQELLKEGDWLVQLSQSLADARYIRWSLEHEFASSYPVDSLAKPLPVSEIPTQRVVILGWNRKIPALTAELGRYEGEAFEVSIISPVSVQVREQAMARISISNRITLRHLEGDLPFLDQDQERLLADSHSLLLAADGAHQTEEEADARTISNLLMVRRLVKHAPKQPAILVELLDEDNMSLVTGLSANTLVTPLLTSHITGQVALRPELNDVFEALFGYGRVAMAPIPASRYGLTGQTVLFPRIQAEAFARSHTALGLLLWQKDGAKQLMLNPSRKQEFTLKEDDQIVCLVSPNKKEK